MLFDNIFAARRSDIIRFSDPETFRPLEFASGAKSLPLDPRNFASTQASIELPSCQIVMQRSFPRILDVTYRTDGILLVVPLEENVRVVANGMNLSSRSLLGLRGQASVKIVEPKDNLYAIVRLKPEICDRGWIEKPDVLHWLKLEPSSIENVRTSLFRIIRAAAGRPEQQMTAGVAHALQEKLLLTLDRIFLSGVPSHTDNKKGLIRYARIVAQIDEWIACNPTRAIHSEELAAICDVSIRTLGTAVFAIRGLALHHYLRLKRLWSVRTLLLGAPGGVTIKACALANGFAHLGEFSQAYKTTFGETASQTRARM